MLVIIGYTKGNSTPGANMRSIIKFNFSVVFFMTQ